MVYKLLNEEGNYIDKISGEPRNIMEAEFAFTPDGVNVGWVELPNLESAIEYFDVIEQSKFEGKMYYYIINNRVVGSDEQLPNSFTQLTEDQKTFYLNNPKASIREILNTTLNIPNITLDDHKDQKITELNNQYQSIIANGYFDETENITLKTSKYDETEFTKLLAMIDLGISLGQTITQMPIADINGNLRMFPILNLKVLLFKYGVYCQTLWATLCSKENEVKNATTVEELENITFN